MARSEVEEDRDAENGYRTAGARELGLRDWMAMRGDPGEFAPTPKAFAAVVNRLRVKKWAKENPERRREIANRYARKPGIFQRQAELSRQRRHELHRSAAQVVTCVECGVEFCLVFPPRGGRPRKFCTITCEHRARYQRITPGARRIKRTGSQP